MARTHCKVVIIGGGVTGTALAYLLSAFSSVKDIILIEKNADVALVNSSPINNSQTLHNGGTETNYPLPHALKVQRAAHMLRRYVASKSDLGLYSKTSRMVLGVADAEVHLLEQRFDLLNRHYPDLRLIRGDKIREIEPSVMEGRDPTESVAALQTNEGYSIDYQRLSQHFVTDASKASRFFEMRFNTTVQDVHHHEDGGYAVVTNKGVVIAEAVVFAAGAYSLMFAHALDVGLNLATINVAGSYFVAKNILKGKVYTVQKEGLPFAAIHGDPDVTDGSITRFGPTTRPLPLMERSDRASWRTFMGERLVSVAGAKALADIIKDRGLFMYGMRNAIYDMPVIGKRLFAREVQKIVPTIKASDLKLRKGAGGIRPQLVDLHLKSLEMGDKTLVKSRCIFNTTPSPGASVCLANAVRDAEQIMKFFEGEHQLDRDRIALELGNFSTLAA